MILGKEVTELLGWRGIPVSHVKYAGVEVAAIVSLDEDEVWRRQLHGLGGVEDRLLWEVLLELPVGQPVPLELLDPVKRAVLDTSPPGVACMSQTHVTRELQAPLSIVGVMQETRNWEAGTEAVSRFSAVANRSLAIHAKPSIRALETMTALGIGVVYLANHSAELLVLPRRTSPRPGSFHSRLLEVVFARWKQDQRSELAPRL